MGININNQPLYEQRASAVVGVQPVNPVDPTGKAGGQNTSKESEDTPRSEPVEREKLDSAVEQLNSYVQTVRRELQFSIHDDSGRTVIKVLDRDSGEVIRQIPSEEALDVLSRLPGASGGDGENPLLFNDLA